MKQNFKRKMNEIEKRMNYHFKNIAKDGVMNPMQDAFVKWALKNASTFTAES